MKLKVNETSLEIIPENAMEIGWIRGVLGLENDGESIPLRRVNAYGLNTIAYLKAKKE